MYRLLGPHINNIVGETGPLITSWEPPVAVFMGHNDALIWMKQNCPRSKFLGRFYRWDEPSIPDMRDPIQEARQYTEWQLQQAEPYREAYWALIGVNEPRVGSIDDMKKLSDFECERIRILNKHGYRAAILSFAEGNPSNIGWLRYAIPAFEEGAKYGAVYARHSYGWPSLQTDAEWRILRHRKEYQGELNDPHNWEGLPSHLQLPIIITETGLEGMIEDPTFPHGWNGHVEASEYMRELQWLDEQLLQDRYTVLGAAIYCLFDIMQWALYNIYPQPAKDIALLANPLYRNYLWNIPRPKRPRGIDVSYSQGKHFSWKKVADAGMKFAFIRASISLYEDSCFRRNVRNSRKQGIPRGVYHFLRNDTNPSSQATFFYNLIKKRKLELPPVLDVEKSPSYGYPELVHVESFLRTFHHLSGKFPMIYTSAHMWQRITNGEIDAYIRSNNIPLWVADWRGLNQPILPSAWDNWEFWQTTSKGTVANKRVDLDMFNGTYSEFAEKYLSG